jgi:DNA uptake protein ComE-like DNA-binding protein
MRMKAALLMLGLGMGLVMAGCSSQPESSQDLKEKTAETTATLKSDAKAVAEGVREGWSRDKPLDLNHATKDQLDELPGISPAAADRVIAGRPYDNPSQVVTRRVLSQAEFDRISDRVTAK